MTFFISVYLKNTFDVEHAKYIYICIPMKQGKISHRGEINKYKYSISSIISDFKREKKINLLLCYAFIPDAMILNIYL